MTVVMSVAALQLPNLHTTLNRHTQSQAPAVRKAVEQAGEAFIESLCPYTTRLVLPYLFDCFDGRRNWQVGSSAAILLWRMCASSYMQLLYLLTFFSIYVLLQTSRSRWAYCGSRATHLTRVCVRCLLNTHCFC